MKTRGTGPALGVAAPKPTAAVVLTVTTAAATAVAAVLFQRRT
jgi:hypothetical protein